MSINVVLRWPEEKITFEIGFILQTVVLSHNSNGQSQKKSEISHFFR